MASIHIKQQLLDPMLANLRFLQIFVLEIFSRLLQLITLDLSIAIN